MSIGNAIKIIRRSKSIKQKHLAIAVGIAPNHLWRVESGLSHPSVALVKTLAKQLQVLPGDILFLALKMEGHSNGNYEDLYQQARPLIDQLIKILPSNN